MSWWWQAAASNGRRRSKRTAWWRCPECGGAHRAGFAVAGIAVSTCPAVPEGTLMIAPSSVYRTFAR